MSERQKRALSETIKRMYALSKEDFDTEMKKHQDGPIARIFRYLRIGNREAPHE